MKRSWISILIVAGVIGLLTLFVGLQYRWLTEVSAADRERMQKRVETDVARFAEDFNREMQAAYYNFQTDAGVWKNADWGEFNQRYDFWKQRTAYPELIRAIYFLPKQPEGKILRYDPANRGFDAAEMTAELDGLRSRFTEDNFRPVYEDAFAMVLPVYEHGKDERIVFRRSENTGIPVIKLPESFGWLVVLLDETVIKDRVLPELSARYFADGFKVSVSDRSGQNIFAANGTTTSADASAPMFNMSPDNLMFFTGRDALPRVMSEHKNGLVINQHRVESHTFTRTDENGKTGTFQLELKQADGKNEPRTTVMRGTSKTGSEPWMLNVQHSAGSIDAFVTSERNKSFAIGLGIYVLLVGGILAIVLSAVRAKRFAQRQVDFVSSVSHEFRTPLAVIYSAGENLADGVAKEDGQVLRYGELIKGEGKKLSGMVEQILEFAGANSGERKFNLAPTDVSTIISDAVEECRPLIESGGFEIETELPNIMPDVLADRTALSSAVQNLIANSVKYSNGSKWIRISAVNGDEAVKISVEDRGIGIRSDDLRRVFDPFYRAKDVVDAQISGNGLGLNLVKRIAEAHGGRVTVESKPGSGSKFTIELPAA